MKVTNKMLQAARLVADGELSRAAIAEYLSITENTLRLWLKNEEVQAEVRRCLRQFAAADVAKSLNVLRSQLDSSAGNGFLAQNAANALLNRTYSAVMGNDDNAVTIRFEAGQQMPAVGVPHPPEDE